jgi:GNAT superfamily N-acetyltransferase
MNPDISSLHKAPVHVRRVSASEAEADAATDNMAHALADVLLDCVAGGASVSFMQPLAPTKALAFWQRVLAGVARGERVLLVAEEAVDGAPGNVVGTVQLITAQPDNQPYRADVAKMLVHRRARRKGVAQQLMAAIDVAAQAAGKTVLVLDTETGGDAERLYQRAGWQRVGDVPNYALMPDGAPCSTTFYFKSLA